MKDKKIICKKFKKFYWVLWLNHCMDKLLLGLVLYACYILVKALVLWRYPTIIFHQYHGGMLASISFYAVLQLLKSPPSLKGALDQIDEIIGHNRGTTFWQFKAKEKRVGTFFIKDCATAIKINLQPLHSYVVFPFQYMVIAIMALAIAMVVHTLPSPNRQLFTQKLAYQENLSRTIETLEESREREEIEGTEKSPLDLENTLKKLEKNLHDDLKNSYSEQESFTLLANYEEERAGLIALTEESINDLPSKEQIAAKKSIESLKNKPINKVIMDAVSSRLQEETMTQEEEKTFLTEGFSELMNKENNSGSGNKEDTLEIASEMTGPTTSSDKNGQGGSGQGYADDGSEIDEGILQKKTEIEKLISAKGPTLQIDSQQVGEAYTLYSQNLNATTDTDTTTLKTNSMETTIEINKVEIVLPDGIPQERMAFVRAYYEGVYDERE